MAKCNEIIDVSIEIPPINVSMRMPNIDMQTIGRGFREDDVGKVVLTPDNDLGVIENDSKRLEISYNSEGHLSFEGVYILEDGRDFKKENCQILSPAEIVKWKKKKQNC